VHLEIYEYARFQRLNMLVPKWIDLCAVLGTVAAFPHHWARYSTNGRGTWWAILIDCIKKTYGRLKGLGIRICTIAETWFSWERNGLDEWKSIFVMARSGGQSAYRRGNGGPSAIYGCGESEIVRAGGTPAVRRRGMQDFGVGAFNGWDDFQGVMIELLSFVD
jgi:hypothetical protein